MLKDGYWAARALSNPDSTSGWKKLNQKWRFFCTIYGLSNIWGLRSTFTRSSWKNNSLHDLGTLWQLLNCLVSPFVVKINFSCNADYQPLIFKGWPKNGLMCQWFSVRSQTRIRDCLPTAVISFILVASYVRYIMSYCRSLLLNGT